MRGKKLVKKTSSLGKKNTKKKRSKRLYFGPATDHAISIFQSTEDLDEKYKIYNDVIQPSFCKLAENLIFIHGFAKNHHSYEALKGDCVAFLYETLQKFDVSRGTKSFSYFNVVAKNWLIIQSKKRVKNLTRNVSLSNFAEMKTRDKETIEQSNCIPSQEDKIIIEENKQILLEMFAKIKKRLNSQNEIACMNAIETLFNRIEDLDYLNKRAVFVYLRDLSGLTPKQLSVSMSNIRKCYKDIKSHDSNYFALFF